ncbi:NAD-dependent epimerase/dehydratase family protein [Serratia entomophila]|uniref:NAD-dependent epimerase/dehydratase family protein n=1 Tax=Serratia entomophila TaxID=42906 RepID=UPI002178C03D|nr:NAD-dependent epimerase/dehydratase family protein [Serratia entomophila]CAI0777625.1 Cholesterol dehydrogenase [Serratia entomophila]CAI1500110.1 Cholesterol dehydrogenase [Serratia entomophila]CAI1508134.1 Cholesterol dehydrogenase [Serratia entomophila]CAI1509949.1 Cholesterol dehydrogenase [Serratia entomophila]CAI1609478.1 Cholesterol dehydrogenase [Serratia entomophila]
MTGTVAVTGATGFIGRHIVHELLAQGFSVRALTRRTGKAAADNLLWVPGALEDQASLAELVRGADCIVHCAGQVRGHAETVFTRCNVAGSLNLMQAAKRSGDCKRFLFMSSLAARHPQLSWYANSKCVAEQQLTAAASDIALGIFRPTAVYGPGDKELKPLFNGLLRGVLPRLGAPEAKLSFLHVSDLAKAVSQWLLAQPAQPNIYELCDGAAEGYSWRRLKEIGAAVRQGPVLLVGIPLPLLKFMADIGTSWNRMAKQEPMLTRSKIRELTHSDWSASNQSLSQQIDWLPQVSLERALREGLF